MSHRMNHKTPEDASGPTGMTAACLVCAGRQTRRQQGIPLQPRDAPRTSPASAEVLYALAQALGVTMSDLMGRKLLAAAAPTVPPSLEEFAEEDNLTQADISMLASIQFRGEQPRTAARWRYIYQSIRGSSRLDETTPAEARRPCCLQVTPTRVSCITLPGVTR